MPEDVLTLARAFDFAAGGHSDPVIGQHVHLVCMPKTALRPDTMADVELFGREAAVCFPSAAIQVAHATFDGRLRKVLIARIRTGDSDAVVAFGQRLCRVFDQRVVGIEVGGRYIRIYSDDTG